MRAAIPMLSILLCAALTAQGAPVNLALSGIGSFTVPVVSLKEARFRQVVHQQYDFSCGSAAVATLLSYHYGHPVSEREVFRVMYEHGDKNKIRREGFSLLDMKRYLEANGYRADGFHTSLEQLERVGIPAIVLIRDNHYAHFVVIKGVRADQVLAGDPSVGARVIPRAQFERLWQNRILFVVRNRREEAQFNTPADWRVRQKAPLQAALDARSLSSITLLRPGANDF